MRLVWSSILPYELVSHRYIYRLHFRIPVYHRTGFKSGIRYSVVLFFQSLGETVLLLYYTTGYWSTVQLVHNGTPVQHRELYPTDHNIQQRFAKRNPIRSVFYNHNQLSTTRTHLTTNEESNLNRSNNTVQSQHIIQ
jgi:hypothetical protein